MSATTKDMYGSAFTNKHIINGTVSWPQNSSEFHSALDRYAARASRRLQYR